MAQQAGARARDASAAAGLGHRRVARAEPQPEFGVAESAPEVLYEG